ncbi:3165_t:CDS:2, partial [Scutellospora calospora]
DIKTDFNALDEKVSSKSKLTEQAQNHSNNSCELTGECTCKLVGECEPCNEIESKAESYCKPYGKKEEIKCEWNSTSKPDNLPKYRSCRRVKRLERVKYFEFQFVNVFIACMSCAILFYRRQKLTADGYRRLARRIG